MIIPKPMKMKTLVIALWIMFFSSLFAIIKIAFGLVDYLKTTINPGETPIFWATLTQLRLEGIAFILCLGFILLYYKD